MGARQRRRPSGKYAFRPQQIHRTAKPASTAPRSQPIDWLPHAAGQPGPWFARRIRHFVASSSQPGAQGPAKLIEEENSLLSGLGRQLLAGLCQELCALEHRSIEAMEEQIDHIHHSNVLCQRIAAIEGVGRVIATAVVAAIADGRAFHNGRQVVVRALNKTLTRK